MKPKDPETRFKEWAQAIERLSKNPLGNTPAEQTLASLLKISVEKTGANRFMPLMIEFLEKNPKYYQKVKTILAKRAQNMIKLRDAQRARMRFSHNPRSSTRRSPPKRR